MSERGWPKAPVNWGESAPRLERREWILFALLLLCYSYFLPRYADWNQNSRLDLVLSIVDHGRLDIDLYADNTGDYAEFGGHRYSDKAPGPALLAVPVYAIARVAFQLPVFEALIERLSRTSALRETLKDATAPRAKVEFALAQAVVTWFVVSLPAALFGVWFYRGLGLFGASEPARLLTTLGYGLATSAFPYAGNFYSHQLCAVLLFTSFLLLAADRPARGGVLLVVGSLLGVALISEYSTALIVGPLLLYAYWRLRRWQPLAPIVAGMLPPLLMMSVHNLAIFGTPLPVGYAYSTLWQAEHTTGFFSLTVPRPETLWELTFGSFRGLFYLSPVLLLAATGFLWFARDAARRAEFLLASWSVLAYLAFNSASAMPYGGFAVGPRYLVPMLPFLAIGLGYLWQAVGSRRLPRAGILAVACYSAFAVWAETIATQSFPTYQPNPLWSVSVPALLAGDVARNWGTLLGLPGLASLVPLLLGVSLLLPSLLQARPCGPSRSSAPPVGAVRPGRSRSLPGSAV